MASDATGFDPLTHRFGEPRYFEEMKVGETFYLPSRTLSDANFAAFQTVSGDNHPIHYDLEYCRRQGHPGLLAHGFRQVNPARDDAHVLGAQPSSLPRERRRRRDHEPGAPENATGQ